MILWYMVLLTLVVDLVTRTFKCDKIIGTTLQRIQLSLCRALRIRKTCWLTVASAFWSTVPKLVVPVGTSRAGGADAMAI
jgi:hypothetical protein